MSEAERPRGRTRIPAAGPLHSAAAHPAGGENLVAREVVTEVQRYDPSADRWELLGDLPVPVHGVASAVHGDAIYLFGGSQNAASGVGVTTVQRLAFAPLPSTGGKPARPTRLTAKPAAAGAVSLAWRDNARNEIEYVVEVRAPGAKGFKAAATRPPDTAAVTLTGFDRSGVYRFRVVAVSSTHRSPPSNVAQVRVERR